jgi:hypothetical protein
MNCICGFQFKLIFQLLFCLELDFSVRENTRDLKLKLRKYHVENLDVFVNFLLK